MAGKGLQQGTEGLLGQKVSKPLGICLAKKEEEKQKFLWEVNSFPGFLHEFGPIYLGFHRKKERIPKGHKGENRG